MAPRTIMVIRHGEKPADSGAPHGVDKHGQVDGHRLIVRGWTRAGALAVLFGRITPSPLARPQRILATKPTSSYESKRERDTARPTAERLGLAIDDSFTHEQVSEAVQSVLAKDDDTLIVWHHGTIPDLVRQLPLAAGVEAPKAWPEDRYDLIWCFTANGSGNYTLQVVPQDLLAGDQSATP